jgi:hypothetical protein
MIQKAALLSQISNLVEYQKGVDRLKDNPEDNILTKPVK